MDSATLFLTVLVASKITIPAVKISGTAPSAPLMSDVPDPCLSILDEPLYSEENEFGEFLLDAVDWL